MSTHPTRPTRAGIALVVALGLGSLGACSAAPSSTTGAASAGSSIEGASGPAVDAAASSDTIALISAADTQTDTQTGSKTDRKGDHKGLRSRLLRAVHATWVTDAKAGPVTHEAIRGEVTAVSATSITVKAKDGVSMTFTVGADTKVRARVATKGTQGTKATDSSVSAVKVGQKALVVGVGATSPTARRIAYLTR